MKKTIIKMTKLYIAIFTDYANKDKCKAIPTRRWNPDEKCWMYQMRKVVLQEIANTFPKEFETQLKPQYLEIFKKNLLISPVKEDEEDLVYEPFVPQATSEQVLENLSKLKGNLMPFQKDSVFYAMEKKKVFIADEMGLGKTVQALAIIQATQSYPALIVSPATVKYNWKKEAENWLPSDVKVSVAKNSKDFDDALDGDVVIVNYELLTRNLDVVKTRGFRILICDECHYIKNSKAKRTKSIEAFSKGIEYVLMLSGTPLLSRPAELIAQLKIIDRLNNLGGWMNYVLRYCEAYRGKWGWDISGASNLHELNVKLRNLCYIRREKKEVLKDLPDKQRSHIFFELNSTQMAEYAKAKHRLEDFLRENLEKNENEIRRTMSAQALTQVEILKALTARLKLENAKAWIHDFLESGQKLLVFATHRAIISELLEEFPDALSITGDTSAEDRQKVVETFQNDETVNLAILGLQAASTGITMTAASNVAFMELGWTPAEMAQAEDRVYRIGQKNAVNIWYLLAKDTIDVKIAALIDSKKDVTKAVIEGRDAEAREKILTSVLKEFLPKKRGRKKKEATA